MTQEEKNLLLKDLCGRLPYIQLVYVEWNEPDVDDGEDEPNIHTLTSCNLYGECILDDGVYKMNDGIKPYLRPMSSMTEEEKEEYINLFEGMPFCPDPISLLDWLNTHYFDYRGLIPMGLALEALEGMYK